MKKIFLPSALVVLNLSFLFAGVPVNPVAEQKNISVAQSESYASQNQLAPPAGIDNPEKETSFSISVTPNPATDHIDVLLNSNVSLLKELTLFDVTGKLIKTIPNSQMDQGKNKLTVTRDNLPRGVYFLVVKTTSEEHCRKIIFS